MSGGTGTGLSSFSSFSSLIFFSLSALSFSSFLFLSSLSLDRDLDRDLLFFF